jgi:hypothetical protein
VTKNCANLTAKENGRTALANAQQKAKLTTKALAFAHPYTTQNVKKTQKKTKLLLTEKNNYVIHITANGQAIHATVALAKTGMTSLICAKINLLT